jgi:hypothetical protein
VTLNGADSGQIGPGPAPCAPCCGRCVSNRHERPYCCIVSIVDAVPLSQHRCAVCGARANWRFATLCLLSCQTPNRWPTNALRRFGCVTTGSHWRLRSARWIRAPLLVPLTPMLDPQQQPTSNSLRPPLSHATFQVLGMHARRASCERPITMHGMAPKRGEGPSHFVCVSTRCSGDSPVSASHA